MSLFEALALIYQSLQSNLGQLPTFPCCLSTTTLVLSVPGSFFPLLYMNQFCPQHTREDLIYRKSLVVLNTSSVCELLFMFLFSRGRNEGSPPRIGRHCAPKYQQVLKCLMWFPVAACRSSLKYDATKSEYCQLEKQMCIDETFNSEGSTMGGQKSHCCCLENKVKLLAYISS